MTFKFLLSRTIWFVLTLQCLGLICLYAEGSSSFLGDPGTDLDTARARLRERKEQRLRWELATTVETYDRIGAKNPRWDALAQDALSHYAKFLAHDCDAGCEADLKAAFTKVLSAGCTDPLVVYFSLRLDCYPPDISPLDRAKLYLNVEERLQASEYAPIRKCYASVRAAEQVLKASQAPSETRAVLKNLIPELLTRAEVQFEYLLRDQSANRDSVYDLIEKTFLHVARDTPDGRTRVFEPLARFFEANSSRLAGDAPGAGLIEANFWIQYAWHARGYGWSSSVTKEGWILFDERLKKAQSILEKAWAADASDPNIAIQMMTVELGQGLGRERLETWFRRAIDADPDSYEACTHKMVYLEPKWHGNEQELFAFANECLATANWHSRIPFILLYAHTELANVRDKPQEYWKRLDVWNDVQKLYTACFAANPNSIFDRSGYALHAYRAEKWKLANELFAGLGEKPDLHALDCSMQEYQQMRRTAAAKTEKQ